MIEEDYVSFETAKLLKGVGFDQNCATYYLDGQVWCHCHGEVIPKNKQIYAAPTHQNVKRWLLKNYNIFICVFFMEDLNGFGYTIEDVVNKKCIASSGVSSYKEPEEACEAAIKYCLENFI